MILQPSQGSFSKSASAPVRFPNDTWPAISFYSFPHVLRAGFRRMTGYSFSGHLLSFASLYIHLCILYWCQSVYTPFLFCFLHATDMLCQKDVKFAALCSQSDLPGYGIYRLHFQLFTAFLIVKWYFWSSVMKHS